MKKKFSALLAAALLAGCLAGCGADNAAGSQQGDDVNTAPAAEPLYVAPIEGLTEDFYRGVDVSSFLAQTESGVVYRDFDGNALDDAGFFRLLAQSGVNWVRLRVWNDPQDKDGNTYGGGHNDVATAAAIGKLATDAGLKVLIDFHYSDFWADPSKQMAPKAWAHLTLADKTDALAQFTTDALTELLSAGVDVQMVQVGNETNNGMAGETDPARQYALMQAGCAAVRAVAAENQRDIAIAVHYTNADSDGFADYCGALLDAGVDLDVFAASYYPYWHGAAAKLSQTLQSIVDTYHKDVMVAETSYPYTYDDGDGFANSIGEDTDGVEMAYTVSVQGQANEVREVMAAVAAVAPDESGAKGLGVFYWEPAWVPVQHYYAEAGDAAQTLASNRQKWETLGSGWATSFAKTYDPNDAGQYYGGSSWDNQAMFDFDGKAMESLKVFGLALTGSDGVENVAVSAPDLELDCPVGEKLALPEETVVRLLDDSTAPADIIWDMDSLETVSTDAPGEYEVSGMATPKGGDPLTEAYPFVARLHVKDLNYIQNPGFEEKDMAVWEISDTAVIDREMDNNKRTGDYSLKYYSESAVKYEVTQTIEALPAGSYRLSGWLQGGGAGAADTYQLYIVINGQETAADVGVSGWQNWAQAELTGLEIPAGAAVTVGVRADAAAKAWGAWDDLELTKEEN